MYFLKYIFFLELYNAVFSFDLIEIKSWALTHGDSIPVFRLLEGSTIEYCSYKKSIKYLFVFSYSSV